MAKLGEVCLLKAGKFVSSNDISPEYNKGLYPCFGGNGIRGYVADYTHDGEFPLIGRQGALCGNVNLASGKFHATEHAVVVQPKIEMNVHWLYYALNAMNLGQYATGAAQPGLAVSKLETLSIEIPNISEQNKIAQTLYKVEQLVNFRKQQLEKLDELVKARFVEVFGEPRSNPWGFDKKPLKSTCKVITGNTPSRNESENYGDFIEWIKTDNIIAGLLNPASAVEKLSEEGAKRGKIVHKGAILMACIAGSVASIGRVCVTDRTVAFNQQINAVIPEKYNVLFLHTLFQISKDYLIEEVNLSLKGILSKSKLENKEFIVPPLSLQNDFAAFVERVDQQKQTVQQSLEKLELMKKALMQEYFG